MKNPILTFLVATTMWLSTTLYAYAEWRIYKNTRFGFEINYPANLFSTQLPAPHNNDGRIFQSANGRASLTVSGGYNGLEQTPRNYLKWAKEKVGVVDKVTYELVKPKWVVVSGFKGDLIYYEKTIYSCDDRILNSVRLSYPIVDKKKYTPFVSKITKSLRPGVGYGSFEDCHYDPKP